jgi:hypothetical protein
MTLTSIFHILIEFLTKDDLPMVWNNHTMEKFFRVRIADLAVDGVCKPHIELNIYFNAQIPPVLYAKLNSIVRTAITKYNKIDAMGGVSLENFQLSWKKGSKKFRKILHGNEKHFVPHSIVKFATNTDTVIDVDCSKKLNKMWATRHFSNAMQTFLYKLYNNLLPTNTVLSHFVRGHSRNCTFCDVRRNPEIIDETILHLFYDCEPISALITNFFRLFTNDEYWNISRYEFFCCFRTVDDPNKNFILTSYNYEQNVAFFYMGKQT